MSRIPAPDLYGKVKLPKVQSIAEEWYSKWNIDGMSLGQIRQVIDIMYVSYKIMCMKGKSKIDACKSIIQCFTGTLSNWWEIQSSPALLDKMEKEVLKDESGYIIYHENGLLERNMIGALTTLILEHWCGTKQ
jgi:hypothetical protein